MEVTLVPSQVLTIPILYDLAVSVYSRNMVKNCRGFRSWPPQDVRILFCLANTLWLNAGSVPNESKMRNMQLQRGTICYAKTSRFTKPPKKPACPHTFPLIFFSNAICKTGHSTTNLKPAKGVGKEKAAT